MATSSVTEAELRSTVERMEARWLHSAVPAVAALIAEYPRLCAQFEVDLGAAPRDVLLAKSAVLMLIQAVANGQSPAKPATGRGC